jgi:hypothetical protein
MAGLPGRSGGARRGAGRKKTSVHAELREMLDTEFPRDKRVHLLLSLGAQARTDTRAAALLLSYLYGSPAQLDDIQIAERVEAEVEAILETLEESLDAATFEKVCAILSPDEGDAQADGE